MTPDPYALHRALVALPAWSWEPGMAWFTLGADEDTGEEYEDGGRGRYPEDNPEDGALPDLDDHATLGCLLGLVRAAWGEPGAGIRQRTGGTWQVIPKGAGNRLAEGESEAEALVDALRAAMPPTFEESVASGVPRP